MCSNTVLVLNGFDVSEFILEDGYEWSLNDIEDPKAGRTLDGIMHRGRIGAKRKIKVSCRPLTNENLSLLLNAIEPEFIDNVIYLDAQNGTLNTGTFYSNNKTIKCKRVVKDGVSYWSGFSFPLIEE